MEEYHFSASAGQSVAFTYQGRQVQAWNVLAPDGTVVAVEPSGSLATVAFVAPSSGTYRLTLRDVKLGIPKLSDIGPFAYTFSPATAAPLDRVVAGAIAVPRQADLYSFAGQKGQTVTLSMYLGQRVFAAVPPAVVNMH